MTRPLEDAILNFITRQEEIVRAIENAGSGMAALYYIKLLEGHTPREISRLFGVSDQGVNQSLRRTIKRSAPQ